MNDRPREILRQILSRYGNGLIDEPRRCEALLRDLCPESRREVFALVQAAQSGVPREVIEGVKHEAPTSVINRSAKRLCESLGLNTSVALWAVESWALALGAVSASDLKISCICPACQAKIQSPPSLLGKRVKCPKCREDFTVGGNETSGANSQALQANSAAISTTEQLRKASLPSGRPPTSSPQPQGSQAFPVAEYFVSQGSDSRGPYSLEELLQYPIPAGVLVWRNGFDAWASPMDMPELRQHAIASQGTITSSLATTVTAPPASGFSTVVQPVTAHILPMGTPVNQFEMTVDTRPNFLRSESHGRIGGAPHRGTLILVLGILSVLCFPLGVVAGVVAVVMGNQDLDAMRRGAMDKSGEGITRAGYILGIVAIALFALLFAVGFLGGLAGA